MGDYAVPESIRKYKPKGYMVKKRDKYYYVYSFKSVTENGKRKTKMGPCVGKIVEGIGFISNENYIDNQEVTTLEFGQYKLVLNNTTDIYSLLSSVFAYDDAARIYAMAVISFIHGFTYITDYKDYFDQSYLNLEFPQIKMGYTSLSKLLDNLGRKQNQVHKFEDLLLEQSTKEIAVDGHCIPNYSSDNNLGEYGTKYAKFNGPQVNLLSGYDVNSHNPLFQRIFSGSTVDKVSIQDMFSIKQYENILFIVDRGFYSKENIKLFSDNGNKYIIPVSRHLKIYDKAIENLNLNNSFIYNKGEKSATVIDYQEVTVEGKRIIIYRDVNQNTFECQCYLNDLEDGKKGCTREKYEAIKDFFGMILLETNITDNPKTVFNKYKTRWSIETYFNYLSNQNRFEALKQCDYYQLQGISFVMLITGMIHSSMLRTIKANYPNKSISNLLLESQFVKVHKTKDKWYIQNAKKELRNLFSILNTPLTNEISYTYLKI